MHISLLWTMSLQKTRLNAFVHSNSVYFLKFISKFLLDLVHFEIVYEFFCADQSRQLISVWYDQFRDDFSSQLNFLEKYLISN